VATRGAGAAGDAGEEMQIIIAQRIAQPDMAGFAFGAETSIHFGGHINRPAPNDGQIVGHDAPLQNS
jgi:hypothetical protein